jgi:RNA polymerase sigma factor (sigma-70 family)
MAAATDNDLVRQYLPMVHQIVRQRYGPEFQEELIAAGMEAVWRAGRTWDPEAAVTLSGWVYKRICWDVIEELRRQTQWRKASRWEVRIESLEPPEPDRDLGGVARAGAWSDPVEVVVALETLEEHAHALARLRPRARAIVEAVVIDGRSQTDVADEYGVTQTRVSQLVRAWRAYATV